MPKCYIGAVLAVRSTDPTALTHDAGSLHHSIGVYADAAAAQADMIGIVQAQFPDWQVLADVAELSREKLAAIMQILDAAASEAANG